MTDIILYVNFEPLVLTIDTDISQSVSFDEGVVGGYGVDGLVETIVLRPLDVYGGYGIGGASDAFVTHYASLDAGYNMGGDVNMVLAMFAEAFGDGYGVNGDCSVILTRRRFINEADSMTVSDMDVMTIANIEHITLE